MDRCLLDTDIFSEVMKAKNAKVVAASGAYRAVFGCITVSAITVSEVVRGFAKARQDERMARFLGVLPALDILPLDTDSAILAGRIYGALDRTGQPIGRADPMIAAVAIHHGLQLNTGNTHHFERIRLLGFDLKLGNWRD